MISQGCKKESEPGYALADILPSRIGPMLYQGIIYPSLFHALLITQPSHLHASEMRRIFSMRPSQIGKMGRSRPEGRKLLGMIHARWDSVRTQTLMNMAAVMLVRDKIRSIFPPERLPDCQGYCTISCTLRLRQELSIIFQNTRRTGRRHASFARHTAHFYVYQCSLALGTWLPLEMVRAYMLQSIINNQNFVELGDLRLPLINNSETATWRFPLERPRNQRR